MFLRTCYNFLINNLFAIFSMNPFIIFQSVFLQVRFTHAFKGLISPPSEPPGEIMSFGVSPVNYSDNDIYMKYTQFLKLLLATIDKLTT